MQEIKQMYTEECKNTKNSDYPFRSEIIMKNMFDNVSTFIGPSTLTGRVLRIRVRPSVLLSGIFLEIGSLYFSKTQDVARDPCGVLRDRAEFFEKKIF